MPKDNTPRTADEIKEARRVAEKLTGIELTDEEVARLTQTSANTSGRTIHVDELPPRDTSERGAHAKPSRLGRVLRSKKKG